MKIWRKSVSEVYGQILVVDGIEQPHYEEIVEIRTGSGQILKGRVLEAHAGKAVVQVFDSTVGANVEDTVVNMRGDTFKFGVSRDMLGRVFTGFGELQDGYQPFIPERELDINGAAINPQQRVLPHQFMQTGVSSIDTLSPLIRGQKLPIFSEAGLPHSKLAVQIAKQAQTKDSEDTEFAIVFGAMGITYEESEFFISELTNTGALGRTVMFINLADDPVIERITLPRLALTTAEYLAYEQGMHVLVIMSDMTNYCNALREIAAARKEIPGRRGYPGYMYTDLASLYERAGIVKGKPGSVTQLPILTMPEGDKTHPVPDLTGYITEGQIVVTSELDKKGIYPPIDVLASLSRLNTKVGEKTTRADHPGVMAQLFAAYAKGKELRELAQIFGESSLTNIDRDYLQFAEQLEQKFINQNFADNRTIEDTLDLGWKLLELLPRSELKKVKAEHIEKYMES